MNALTKLARRQLAMYEALRRLGFQPDQIFVTFYNGDPVTGADVFTELRVDGKVFKSNFRGEKKVTREAYLATWTRENVWWNEKANRKEKLAIYQKEFSVSMLLSLATAIASKGITVPLLERKDSA